MKTLILTIVLTLTSLTLTAQQIEGKEFGIDGTFSLSSFGGNVNLGPKFGFKTSENFIFGPSVRYQRVWANNQNTGTSSGYNVFGAGAFAHGRFYNALFLGAEFEMMRSPFTSFGALTTNPTWTPTLFLGGGFSMEFNESWRLNAGILYDIINHENSPFRSGYFLRNANNQLLPVIYRIAFFFPLD